jgi:hypothetical protein
MPGFLIPADLSRMIPVDANPLKWAEENLLASTGALVMDSRNGRQFRIFTLVPATKQDGSCVHLTKEGACSIHDVSPFGCAFFDCQSATQEAADLLCRGLLAVQDAFEDAWLYRQIWAHLSLLGRVQRPAEELRREMRRV